MSSLINYIKKTFSFFMVLLMLSTTTKAGITSAASASSTAQPIDLLSVFIIGLLGFIILVLLFVLVALKIFIDKTRVEANEETLVASLIRKLTDTVPVEQEDVILTDHIYDGIQELDNNLPPWWKYMFYATIVFSGLYIYYYHFSSVKQLQADEYDKEMVVAKKEIDEYMKLAANSIDETNVKLSNAKGIENGKAIFLQNCAACHGRAGEGGVGPNLTDEYWLHGGGVKDVFKTIKYGVPQKGMISWKAQLSPSNIQDVSSYIKTLKGTNPPNPKETQGEKYDEKKEVAVK